ncbi:MULTISPECIES: hypothetical protein [Parabacteroides]|uniref:hypothetical protein n=1 Tax=Parabacteroides leei TaxID=2939491 RepID=UPI00189780F3|nr:hypothetical protein [Parabacteroides goldsteinii]
MKQVFTILTILLFLCYCTNPDKDNSINSNPDLAQKKFLEQKNKSEGEAYPLKPENWPRRISLATYRKNLLIIRDYHREKKKYPDFYGGNFTDDDYNLIIYIVGDTLEGKKEMAKILNSTDFSIKSCNFSYNHLTKVDSILTKFLQDKKNSSMIDSIKIVSHMLNFKDNHISVRLKECNDTIINIFKNNILDDECIVFIEDSSDVVPVIIY